jgi:hypothetical protein
LGALKHRHDLVVSEMQLRGYRHHSPVTVQTSSAWPDRFVDPPGQQFTILGKKYVDREPGRIPLPRTVTELWAHHRFSVLARDPEYQRQNGVTFAQFAHDLVEMLRRRPSERQLARALDLMWEHVAGLTQVTYPDVRNDPEALIAAARQSSTGHRVIPLLESTALSDLHTWITASSAGQRTRERKDTDEH